MSMWRISVRFAIKIHQNLMRERKLNNRINPAIAYERVLAFRWFCHAVFLFISNLAIPPDK